MFFLSVSSNSLNPKPHWNEPFRVCVQGWTHRGKPARWQSYLVTGLPFWTPFCKHVWYMIWTSTSISCNLGDFTSITSRGLVLLYFTTIISPMSFVMPFVLTGNDIGQLVFLHMYKHCHDHEISLAQCFLRVCDKGWWLHVMPILSPLISLCNLLEDHVTP